MEKLRKNSRELLEEMESTALEITPLRLDAGKYASMRSSAVNNLDRAKDVEDKPKNFGRDGIDGNEGVLDLTGISSTDTDEERQGWGSKGQFLLSVVAFAVGLGNVWRFPYLCQQNGGGAFLIPYFIMLFVEGIPLCVLELGIGQRLRMGSIGVWSKIHPLLGGLGISCNVVSLMVGIYYTGVIAWCFFYLFSSIQTRLPWTDCPTTFNPYANVTITEPECAASSPTAYFWFRETLDVTPSIDDFGGMQWKLAGCMAISWILIYICMSRGIENSGKVMYFTAGFPYFVLVIFLGRAVTLRGAVDGLRFLFTPQMEKLKDPIVWLDAATQIFYSLGLGFGSLIAFGSYNPTKNKFTRDAVFVSLTNAFTAIFASVVVFSILGFKATVQMENCACREIYELAPMLKLSPQELTFATDTPEHCTNYHGLLTANPSLFGLPRDAFVNSSCNLPKLMTEAAEGTGLAFIVFTQAIVELPLAPIWSILFFTMLLALGMGSMFGNLAGIQTSVFDLRLFPWLKKQVLSAIICTGSFLIGLLFVTKSGLYWIGMFDNFAGTFSLMVIALMEMIAVCYVYGYSRFAADVKEMTGQTLSIYWSITLKFLAPAVIVLVLAASIAVRAMKGINYSAYDINTASTHSVDYPVWAQVVCVALILAGILPIVLVAIVRKLGLRKLDVDPSMVNTGFSTSTSTATFMRPEVSVASFDFDSGVGRNSQERPQGQYLNIYRPHFHASHN